MGPIQSQQSKPAQVVNQNGQVEQMSINHPRFNNFKVIKLPTQQEEGIIQLLLPLANQTQFKNWDLKLKRFGEAQNIFLPLSQKFAKTQFCGSAGLCTAQYKYYPYLLSDEIVNRRGLEGKQFQQPQLWYLVYSILQAAKKFHQYQQKLGDIRPQNIFISPDGQVAVATQYTWPGQRTNYQRTALQKQLTYLSPQQLKDINYGKLQQSTNFSINQSFSIGLTCLDAATLNNSISLYDNNNKFNYNKLQEMLGQLQSSGNYTQPLVLLIQTLCQVDPEKRTNCKELVQWLHNYQDDIIDLNPFTVRQLPDKLANLRVQKLKNKNSRPQQQAPKGYIPPQNQQVNYVQTTYVNPPQQQTYINQPQQVIRQQQTKYMVQNIPYHQSLPQNVNHSIPQNRVYNNSVSFHTQQTQINNTNGPSTGVNFSGSGFNVPPHLNNVQNQSNNQTNPSIITFQNDVNKGYTGNSQIRSNLNLQQIDQQLQMSRKLFPS